MIYNKIDSACFNALEPTSMSYAGLGLRPKSILSELQANLDSLCDELATSDQTDLLGRIDKLVQNQSLEMLSEACAINPQDALKQAKKMLVEADSYLQAVKSDASPSLRSRFHDAVEALVAVIQSIIDAFGITSFFKHSENEIQSEFKGQKIMMLLSLSTMVTSLVVPVFGAEVAASIIGGFFAVIAALSMVWKYLKPAPHHLPNNAENWTNEVRRTTNQINGRKDSLDEIAAILKMNRHPILVGPSRVGKSVTAKAFAQAIARGDYPELQGKVVFRYNTADLVDHQASFMGGGNSALKDIAEAMGRHRNDMILVFDEIHMACKDEAKLGDQLKTYLDQGGEFPHVIGITTSEEYQAYILSNTAFSRRFDKVDIRNADQSETLKILSDTLLKSASKPIVEHDALPYIYESSGGDDVPQPARALHLLQRCIDATVKVEKSSNQQMLNDTAKELKSLRAQAAATRGRGVSIDHIAALEDQLVVLKDIANQEAEQIDRLRRTKQQVTNVTTETYRSVLRVANATQSAMTSSDMLQLKRFVVLHQFLDPLLQKKMGALSAQLGVSSSIDRILIDRLSKSK